ncbi:MAG: transporter substrate-binding domain-containing protein [Bacteroidota bacterium]
MKKTFLLLSLIAASAILLFTHCDRKSEEAYRFKFQFITEDYKPLNYLENDTLKGLAPDILRAVCTELNIPFSVQVLPWAQGYSLVQEADNAVLFSTMLNSTRKDLFKWAGPIASLDWMFYSTSYNEASLASIDDAKKAGRIGVVKDYAITQYLIQEGFTNLVYCTDNIDAFDKLLKREIDLFPSDKITAEAALETMDKSIYSVTSGLIIRTDLIYFAFNKNVPDDVVADFQQEIDRLKENGTLKLLTQQYLNTSDFPGTLQIYTEQYPPLTFRNAFGEITGFGSDIVYEIMKRNQLYSGIKLTFWSIGYELALNNPNVCLFTMDRTEIREDLFQWVGPIGTNTTWFFTKAGSGVIINSMEDARNLTAVGTVSSWFSTQYLQELGFTNLVADRDPSVMAKKLMDGEIDAFVCSDVTFPDILKEAEYQYSDVVPAFSLMSSDYYIAFSKNTAEAIVNQWQSTLESMKQDSTYYAIYAKWLK